MSYPYTVEQFREAYRKTGLIPRTATTLNRLSHCGCPQAALALSIDGDVKKEPKEQNYDWARRVIGVTFEQFWAFVLGFDDANATLKSSQSEYPGADGAFEVGRACRREFLGID